MKASSTQQPLVVLVLRSGDVPDVGAALEAAGAIVIAVESIDGARETMQKRDTDMFVVAAGDVELCLAARVMIHRSGYRPPLIACCADLDDETIERMTNLGRDVAVRDLSDLPDLVRSWLVVGRIHQKVRRYEREMPARASEMDDLRRFTDELIASLPARLYIVDGEMRVLFANRTALEEANTTLRGVVGRPFAQLVPAAGSGSRFEEAIRRVLDTGDSERLYGLSVPSDSGLGEDIFNADIGPSAMSDAPCARIMLDDVTDEIIAERDRLLEATKLHTVVDAIGAGVATLDRDLRFTWTNRAFAEWFGGCIGLHCTHVCGRTDEECDVCPGREAIRGGGITPETWKRTTADGRQRTLQTTFVPLPEADGSHSLILLVLDVTEQADRVEQMQVVGSIGKAIQGVLELDELLHLILTCVTTGQALGFNRAFLFLRNRTTNTLDGRIAVGPASAEEAGRVWGELSARQQTLDDALRDAASLGPVQQPLRAVLDGVSMPLDDLSELPVRVFAERRSIIVTDAGADERVTSEFRARFGAKEFIAVPLVSQGRSLGVIMADNLYNNRPVTAHDLSLLEMFCGTAGLAIENAETFSDLRVSLDTIRSTRRQLVDQTKLAAIGRVAAHLAHEIRNPLATIGGFAHAIHHRPENTDRVKMSSSIIYEEVMRLERLLSGIMDFSRPTRPVFAWQPLNDLVKRAIEVVEPQLPEQVEVEADLDDRIENLSFDANQLQQVIINVVKNAAEAMGDRGGLVTLTTSGLEDNVLLSIADDGPGIPHEVQAKVFEPFFTTKKGGTGLGLAVCRHIVAEHGGDLRITSEPGEGAIIDIVLPCEPPPISDEFDEDEDLP